MASPQRSFFRLWQDEEIRDRLFELLPREDICSVRLASSACCNVVTKRLFTRITVNFAASTFTRPCRVQALSRIGHHIEHLTFNFPHSPSTFLPPLVHPETGREISFLYTPHTSMGSVLTRPKYANTELGEILTQQYPPLFHAATNVPSFINAIKHIPNLRHLTVRCPGQDPQERYRRDIVDYALISLRISIERVALTKLTKLSLSGMHPSAFNYLRHVPGFGSVPSAARRWRQIKKLHISVEAWDFYGSSPGLDHLKILDDYIRFFAPQLEKFTFAWVGRRKGPCPLSLASDPLFAPPRQTRKLFNEVTSPMSPLPATPSLRAPVWFPKLKYLQVRNATMTASQLSDLVTSHQDTVKEYDFENVALVDGSDVDTAFAPLTEAQGRDLWSRTSNHYYGPPVLSDTHSVLTASSQVAFSSDDMPPSPSAAVRAASRELMDIDFGLSGLSLEDFDDQQQQHVDMDDLASEIAAAQEASQSFSTKLRKKRLHRRRRRRHHHDHEDEGVVLEEKERDRSRSRHRKHGEEKSGKSRSKSRHRKHRHGNRERKDSGVGLEEDLNFFPRPQSPTPLIPLRSEPSNLTNLTTVSSNSSSLYSQSNSQFDSGFTSNTSFTSNSYAAIPPPLSLKSERSNITAPILNSDPTPVLLQPTVYDPHAPRMANPDEGISSVQRNIEADERQRLLAENDEMRVSALRKAKEAVLMKLSKEFRRKVSGANNAGVNAPGPSAVSAMPPRIDIPLFGAVPMPTASAVGVEGESAYPKPKGRLFGEAWFGRSMISVAASDHRSIETQSQSVLVPLMFSR